ncbi:MAG: CoA-binding protein, partial [Desulfurococcaceae archaeon]
RTPPDLREELRKILPPHCIVDNPIDLTGDTDDQRYINVLEKVIPREDVDAVVVVALPQVPGIRGELFNYIIEAKRKYDKPLVTVIIGGPEAEKFKNMLEHNEIPVFESPERAARALGALFKYSLTRGVARRYEGGVG